MSNNTETAVLRGKVSYFKFLGEPRLNYQKDGKEWTADFYDLSEDALKMLKNLGVADRVKSKDDYLDGQKYIQFKQKETTTNGSANRKIMVVDKDGQAWPEDKLIGNGSVVDVKFVVVDFGKGLKKGVYPRAFRVLKHVPYVAQTFAPLDEEDEFYGERNDYQEFQSDFGLDDEIPE